MITYAQCQLMESTATARRQTVGQLAQLIEGCTAGRVNRNAGVIRGCKILGAESKNGRTYSPKAMQSAAKLYEDMDVNIDHPDRKNPGRERGIRESFGVLKNVQVRDDGVYADLHYLRSHPMAEEIAERAERFPNNFGLSHNASGKVVTRNGRQVVEDIESVRSVDIVTRPATNAGLFESIANRESDSLQFDSTDDVVRFLRSNESSPQAQRNSAMNRRSIFEMEGDMAPAAGDRSGSGSGGGSTIGRLAAEIAEDRKTTDAEKIAKFKALLKIQAEHKVENPGGDQPVGDGREVPAMESTADVVSFLRGKTRTLYG